MCEPFTAVCRVRNILFHRAVAATTILVRGYIVTLGKRCVVGTCQLQLPRKFKNNEEGTRDVKSGFVRTSENASAARYASCSCRVNAIDARTVDHSYGYVPNQLACTGLLSDNPLEQDYGDLQRLCVDTLSTPALRLQQAEVSRRSHFNANIMRPINGKRRGREPWRLARAVGFRALFGFRALMASAPSQLEPLSWSATGPPATPCSCLRLCGRRRSRPCAPGARAAASPA
eukprot:6206074-Pleurochrysis_carterae.AAC.1